MLIIYHICYKRGIHNYQDIQLVLSKHLKKKSTQSIKETTFLILNKGANLDS